MSTKANYIYVYGKFDMNSLVFLNPWYTLFYYEESYGKIQIYCQCYLPLGPYIFI